MLQYRIQKMNEITNIEKLSGNFGDMSGTPSERPQPTEEDHEHESANDISPKSKYLDEIGVSKSSKINKDLRT